MVFVFWWGLDEQGSDLRRLIAENRGLPVERLRLFFRGSTLREDDGGLDVYYTLQHGGVFFFFYNGCFFLFVCLFNDFLDL